MGNLEKIIETLSKLTALEQRTADAVNYVERVEGRINNLYERIARLETAVEVLRENVKNAILADIRSDITRVQTALEYEARGVRSSDGPLAIAGREPKALPGAEIVGKRHTSQREATWTGFYYVNVSNDIPGTCDWDLSIRYSYVSAGGERQWVRAIQRLRSGDKVFAYIKRVGYVGYGVVAEEAVMLRDYHLKGKRLLDELPKDHPWRQFSEDPNATEWITKVGWVKTLPTEQAKRFAGMFVSPYAVCKLSDRRTCDFLVREFGVTQCGGDNAHA